jgi:hypothetical protein
MRTKGNARLITGSVLSNLSQRTFVLQEVQPALLGLMDGSVSTLAPNFAAAGLTGDRLKAFL